MDLGLSATDNTLLGVVILWDLLSSRKLKNLINKAQR